MHLLIRVLEFNCRSSKQTNMFTRNWMCVCVCVHMQVLSLGRTLCPWILERSPNQLKRRYISFYIFSFVLFLYTFPLYIITLFSFLNIYFCSHKVIEASKRIEILKEKIVQFHKDNAVFSAEARLLQKTLALLGNISAQMTSISATKNAMLEMFFNNYMVRMPFYFSGTWF